MGHALIWIEGLAIALFALALATGWATRGHAARGLWVAAVWLAFLAPAAFLVYATAQGMSWHGREVRSTFFPYTLSWLVAFGFLSVFLVWSGRRRSAPGESRSAATWPPRRLWYGVGGSILVLGLTFWNLDLAARADLAIARQEAGAVLLAMTPPPVADAENAARVYDEAVKDLEPMNAVWRQAALGIYDTSGEPFTGKLPSVQELLKRHQATIALLRKAAAMPRASFDHQRTLLDSVSVIPLRQKLYEAGVVLLALDARAQATDGNLRRAFDDVSAILGMIHHLSVELTLVWAWENYAWKALEDVLRLAPAGKEPLPALAVPEMASLVRTVREEHARLGMILPAVAGQPSLMLDRVRERDGPLAVALVEAAVMPTRVFVIPDDLVAMRKLFAEYQKSPRTAADETPADWEELRKSVETDPTSLFSARFMKPKHRKLAADGGALAALRATARTGLAAATYQRKHGKYPEKLEQLVPEFLPAMPIDPRDGQPLRITRVADLVVVYGAQDSERVETGKVKDTGDWRLVPIFRLRGD